MRRCGGQYYWTVSDWGACSAACDGGVQTRAVSCMNSLSGLCAYLPRPLLAVPVLSLHVQSCCPHKT